uniref:Myosin light chain kinase, smooth muscle n=1 Tax=Sparus aurata TaxID=8175 RepID=A0A671UG81_SPAAU
MSNVQLASASSTISQVSALSPGCSSHSNEPPAFILPPRNARVALGGDARLEGKVRGYPEPQVTWHREGRAVIGGERCVATQGGRGTFSLVVGGVREEDLGRYTCQAANQAGSRQVTVEILLEENSGKKFVLSSSVKTGCRSGIPGGDSRPSIWGESPPKFVAKPNRVFAKLGQTGKFSAKATGRPQPRVTWYKGEVELQFCGRVSMYERSGLHFLEIQEVCVEDAGSYTCLVINSAGTATATAVLNVQVCCSPAVSSASVATVTWLKEGVPVRIGPGLQQRQDGTCLTLTIERVRQVDQGTYMCQLITADRATVTSATWTLRVHILMWFWSSGRPLPEVVWLHNGQEVKESEDFHLLRAENRCTLLIQEVFPEDTGIYSCKAWNQHGADSTQCALTVEEPQDGVQPWFITKPRPVSAVVGQHVLLSCAVAGDPFPKYTWTRGDLSRPLTSGVDYELLQKEDVISLLIRRVKNSHCVSEASWRGSLPAGFQVLDRCNSEPLPVCVSGTVSGSAALWPVCLLLMETQTGREHREDKGLLKRCVDTRERGEEELRHREAQQLDFRSLLGRRALNAKHNQEEEPREAGLAATAAKPVHHHQMDFKANLKGVKAKAEENKGNSSQQVDFRSVLGKKGAAGNNKPSETPGKNANDFRSVLANKKKPSPEENGKTAVNNCVDGGNNEKKSGGGGKGPEFVEKLNDVTVLDGQRLRLQCRLASADTAGVNVVWTLDGKTIKPSKFIILANEGGLCSLTIDKALPEDEGQYKCRAEAAAGRAECCCTVLVDGEILSVFYTNVLVVCRDDATLPPQILQFPEDMKILAGEKVEILCKFSGAPPISCTWLKFRKPIQEGSSDISIESCDSSSKLTISSGQQEHCGCYTIELRNSYGLRQAALNLTIVDKPDPPAKVPAASDIRRASLTLSWYGPTYDGGSAVQSYNLEIWDSVEPQWKHLVSCNSTSYNVQNLLPERQYKFRVRAENIYGVGEPSAESEPVTVGLVDDGEQTSEPSRLKQLSGLEKEPDYRDVTIRTDVKVKELYDVEERLGTGKFGQVFKLVEKATKKVWAGKFIKAYSAKEKENVRQEIGIMNSLHHPKLVQCIDAFEGKSDIVMVLEMISGGELFERIIDEDFELTEREVIKYMLQIIDGVNFIHKQGIVHLDLKPENIMCVNKMGSKIKLIDFGLARRLESAGTLKVLFGTPEFVAPEVINYEAISYPTDMWSIGVICYILLSGLSPFMGDNDNETLSNVTSATWDFEDEAFDEISDTAKDFITNLLKKDMKARLTCNVDQTNYRGFIDYIESRCFLSITSACLCGAIGQRARLLTERMVVRAHPGTSSLCSCQHVCTANNLNLVVKQHSCPKTQIYNVPFQGISAFVLQSPERLFCQSRA